MFRRLLTFGAGLPGHVAAIALSALAGVLVGLGGFTVHYAEGFSYLRDDPKACVNCHVMRDHYDGWQHASHHAVAVCNDCHTPTAFLSKYLNKLENGWRHSKGFTLNDFPEPIRIRESNARVVRANCVRCHADLVHPIVGGPDPGARSDCLHCHRHVGHGPLR
jgi:cytochrome c nitrite reductase small subunit